MLKNFSFGLIGHPVSHSLSPLLHEAALFYRGLQGEYRLIDIEPKDLTKKFPELVKTGLTGLNVTIPHKQTIMPLLDAVENDAFQVGAVNTIAFREDDNKSIGYNTDIRGFSKSLEDALERERIDTDWSKSALVIGCGGAARAVVAGLVELGYLDVSIYGRDFSKAQDFVSSLCNSFGPKGDLLLECNLLRAVERIDQDVLGDKSLLINATPIGQNGVPLPDWLSAAIEKLDRRALVYDLVYSRSEQPTPLEEHARRAGVASVDGLDMLILQAAQAFEIWTGITVPGECLKSAVAPHLRN